MKIKRGRWGQLWRAIISVLTGPSRLASPTRRPPDFNPFGRWLMFLLIFELSGLPQLFVTASAASAVPVRVALPGEDYSIRDEFLKLRLPSPLASALDDPTPFELGIRADDPAVDEDPFFLRAQNWGAARETGRYPSITVGGKSWQFELPSRLVLETDDYFFFSAASDYDGFAKKAGGSGGEGVFFVSHEELLLASHSAQPVPVYYLPLPGEGWRGQANGLEIPHNNLVVFEAADGERLPVLLDDIAQVQSAERVNLTLALSLAWQRRLAAGQSPEQAFRLTALDPGLTAGFGMLLTGFDRQNPEKSLFAQGTLPSVFERAKSFLAETLGIRTAHAIVDIPALYPILTAVGSKLAYVMTITGYIAIAGVGLRLSVFRQKFREKAASEPPPQNRRERILREIRYSGDSFAEVAKAVYGIPPVITGKSIKFLIDRYFPKLGSADHTLLKRFLNATVYKVQKAYENMGNNAWAMVLASGCLALLDTSQYILQYLIVTPAILSAIPSNWSFFADRAQNAYGDAAKETQAMVTANIAQTAAGWVEGGAPFIVSETRRALTEAVTSEIDTEMRKERKHPDQAESPKERARREEEMKSRIEARVDHELKLKKFPSLKDFLFDAGTVFDYAFSLVGYRLPKGALEDGRDARQFLAFAGQGIAVSAPQEALKRIEARNQIAGLRSAAYSEAERILEEWVSDQKILPSIMKAPFRAMNRTNGVQGFWSSLKENLLRFRRARETGFAFSYQGEDAVPESLIPASWKRYSREAIQIVFDEVRGAGSDFLNGRPEDRPQVDQGQQYLHKPGMWARWQERRAHRMARERYQTACSRPFDGNVDADGLRCYRDTYARSLMEILNLRPDFSEKPELEVEIAERAAFLTQNELEIIKKSHDLEEELTADQKLELEARLYAENFVETYLEYTVRLRKVPMISPAQPGIFQKWRTIPMVKDSAVWTRILRFLESPWPNMEYRTGLKSALDRYLPLWQDVQGAFVWGLRRIPTYMVIPFAFAFQNSFWALGFTFSAFLLAEATRFMYVAPNETTNRLFSMQGLEPFGKIRLLVMFGMIYTWTSFLGQIPQTLFNQDMKNGVNAVAGPVERHLVSPIQQASAAIREKVKGGWDACRNLLARKADPPKPSAKAN